MDGLDPITGDICYIGYTHFIYIQILNIKHTQNMHVRMDKYSNFSTTHADPLRYVQVLDIRPKMSFERISETSFFFFNFFPFY